MKMNNKAATAGDSSQPSSPDEGCGGAEYPVSAQLKGEGIDILRLLQVGIRRWKLIIIATVLMAGMGWLYLQLSPSTYRASVLLEMSVRRPRLVKESMPMEDSARIDTDMVFNTRLAKFGSQSMFELVAVRYLQTHTESTNSISKLIERLKDTTDWSMHRNSFIVEAEVTSSDPHFSQDVANLYGECATQMMFDENRTTSDNAVVWLQQQAQQKKDALEITDQAIVDYRTRVSIDALFSLKEIGEKTLLKLNDSLINIEDQLIKNRAMLEYLEQVHEDPDAVETIPEGISSTEQLPDYVAAWWNAKIELSTLQSDHTSEHPYVKDAAAKLQQQQRRLEGYLGTITKTILNNTHLLEKQKADVTAHIDVETSRVSGVDLQRIQAEGQLNTLIREQEAADTTYRSVLARIEESRMAADENTAVLKILQPAEFPADPMPSHPLRILALAALLGAMFGYGIGWVLELLDDKIIGIGDVEKMGLEVLSVVPHQKKKERQSLACLCREEKSSHFAETFANLRTTLTYQEARNRYRAILITSTRQEEGKTVIASNLAISMAQSGRKTLLIDLDLRRPRLYKIYKAAPSAESLLHALQQNKPIAFNPLLVPGGIPNLDVITSQSSPAISAAEIIGSNGVEQLIAWARTHYESIIIDSPPLGIVGDAQRIADLVDGVLLVVQPESATRKRELRHAVERLHAVRADVLGAVFSKVRIRWYYAYSSYYQHYNSYYSYGKYTAEDSIPPDDSKG